MLSATQPPLPLGLSLTLDSSGLCKNPTPNLTNAALFSTAVKEHLPRLALLHPLESRYPTHFTCEGDIMLIDSTQNQRLRKAGDVPKLSNPQIPFRDYATETLPWVFRGKVRYLGK